MILKAKLLSKPVWKLHCQAKYSQDHLNEILTIKLSFQESLIALLQSPQQIDIPMQVDPEDFQLSF